MSSSARAVMVSWAVRLGMPVAPVMAGTLANPVLIR
ncbi:hypothetical protein Q427_07215 [Halomonas sp. BC04]|nr:hypothetical protein Q427_07215 [Halomonas sp. BC04]